MSEKGIRTFVCLYCKGVCYSETLPKVGTDV